MIRYWFWLLILFNYSYAQEKFSSHIHASSPFAKPLIDSAYQLSLNIDTPELKSILTFLASDTCQGRELGKPGNDVASNFIAKKLQEYQIPPLSSTGNYFQEVDFKWVSWNNNSIVVDDYEYSQVWDFISIPSDNESLYTETDSLIFLGYGIESPVYNDYSNIDVNNKVIVIYKGEPRNKKGISVIAKDYKESLWSSLEQKLKTAKKHGVKCVWIIEDKFKELSDKRRAEIYSPTVILSKYENKNPYYVNTVFVSSTMLSKILGEQQTKLIRAREKIIKSGKPKHVVFQTKIKIDQSKAIDQVKGKNVMAYIEGNDLKDELVILSAHYDHIGMRGQDIFNGADDNGSGTSGLLQIARTLQLAKSKNMGPRRSVLCLFTTGEEKGLLGSLYYVHDPILPLEKTIVDINIDMIGRIDKKYQGQGKYVYVIGSDRLSLDLHNIHEQINNTYSHFTLDYTYNAESDPNRYYYRSDHYNFAEKGIPSIFFFNGVHEDYHRITDDIEKINFLKLSEVSRHTFLLAWKLANMSEKLRPRKFD